MIKMKTLLFLSLAVLFTATSCVKDIDDDTPTDPNDPNVTKELKGSYSKDVTLQKGTYTLTGYVYIQSGATLKIPAGTIIKSSTSDKGALIVERGGKIDARGTANSPIVFTSGKAAGSRARGDWGGIIILGEAPFNRSLSPRPLIEGGVNRDYGGTNENDNSGVLQYVRIEFAGIAAEPASEINGLTLGAVGKGTTIDHIQVSFGNDDSYELFGGNVNMKNIVAFSGSDDDLDFDFGYVGKIQHAVVLRNPAIFDSDAGNGVEADNDGSGTSATPITHPTLSNVTWIGPNAVAGKISMGNKWRRASRFNVHNSIIMGYPEGGLYLESNETISAYKDGTSKFKNNIVHAVANPFKLKDETVMTTAQVLAKATTDGCIVVADATTLLNSPFSLTAPNFLPKAGSPALSGASFTGMDSWFQTTTYRGAFGAENWMTGWTSFSPESNPY